MEILCTVNNSLLLKIDSGEIYEFNQKNVDVLISELSLDIDTCKELKRKLVDIINNTVDTSHITETSKSDEISQYIINVTTLGEYHIVNQIIDHAMKTYLMISTPKPYDTWMWNELLGKWIPPVEYPKKKVESDPDKYIWSDEDMNWVPVETSPHPSWLWDYDKEEYVSPIPYPLDAGPNDFIWDEEKRYWVIND